MYVESPFLESRRFRRIFRKRFRMPYRRFQEVAAMLAESPLFERWREGKKPLTDQRHLYCCLSFVVFVRLDEGGRSMTCQRTLGSLMKSYESFFRFIEFGSSTVQCKRHVVAP